MILLEVVLLTKDRESNKSDIAIMHFKCKIITGKFYIII